KPQIRRADTPLSELMIGLRRIGGGDRRLTGSLTLMRLFVLTSAVMLVAAAFLLGSILTHTLRSQALTEEQTSLSQYVDGVLGPVVVRNDKVVPTRWLSQTTVRVLHGQRDVVSVKVWRADGTLAWTSLQPTRIGKRFPPDSELGEAIRRKHAAAEDDPAARPVGPAARVVPPPGAERARGDREPQRDGGGARPVHGRPLTARPEHRARHRRGARAAARTPGCPAPRRALPRHRQAARSRRRADEARAAHVRGVRPDQATSGGRRRHRLPPRCDARRASVHPASPRALGRARLSGRTGRRRDPARGSDRRARRRMGRD